MIAVAGPCFARNASTGTIIGTARDATGAVIPRARVKAVNVDTQFLAETVSGSEGKFSLACLAPGNYRLTMESPGLLSNQNSGRITGYSIFNQAGASQANWQLRGRFEW
jgi:hypothetical protein